jgi:hypothetical protein
VKVLVVRSWRARSAQGHIGKELELAIRVTILRSSTNSSAMGWSSVQDELLLAHLQNVGVGHLGLLNDNLPGVDPDKIDQRLREFASFDCSSKECIDE